MFEVNGLLEGLESEVHLALDVMLPASRVVDALKSFRAEFPTVGLRLHMEALGDAGVAGVEQIGVGNVVLISVAAPDHPLASPRTWRFADLGSKHMLLKEGIGWGNMPAHHG
jgi:hypothetical protein